MHPASPVPSLLTSDQPYRPSQPSHCPLPHCLVTLSCSLREAVILGFLCVKTRKMTLAEVETQIRATSQRRRVETAKTPSLLLPYASKQEPDPQLNCALPL